jgi:hypothetical protein
MFLLPLSTTNIEVTEQGIVKMILVHVNANLRAQTIEEMTSQKKTSHLSSMRHRIDQIKYMTSNLRFELSQDKTCKQRKDKESDTFADFVQDLEGFCEKLYKRHLDLPIEKYVDEDTYRKLVGEMLDITPLVQAKIDLWRYDTSYDLKTVHALPPRQTFRLRMCAMEKELWKLSAKSRADTALKICKLKGLVGESILDRSELEECPILQGRFQVA